MRYRSGPGDVNTFYMSQTAIAGLYRILGLSYGGPNFDTTLNSASRKQLDDMLAICRPVLAYMKYIPAWDPEALLADMREVQQAVFGTKAGDCPNAYEDYDEMSRLSGVMRRAVEAVERLVKR